MTQTDYIYLHGFASSPNSAKAQYLGDRFSNLGINMKIPDLNQGDFSHLTITRKLEQLKAQFPSPSQPVTLIGSSLGGWTAAILGEKHPQVKHLVLLAPAFGFPSRWLDKLGEEKLRQWQQEKYSSVYHYGEKRHLPLHYEFIVDAQQYQVDQIQRPVYTLIIHGIDDEVVPIQASRDFVAQRPWVKLIELESDHSLGNVLPEIWEAIQAFCQL